MSHTHDILYLDDESSNLNVFRASFKYDFNIHVTTDAEEAYEILSNNPIKVVISDQKMPKVSGLEFLKQVKEKYPDVIRIILTAYTDIDVIIDAFNICGIYRYIAKPWDANDFKITINNALETFELKVDNKNLVSKLESINKDLEKKVASRTKELTIANDLKSQIFNYISTELKSPIEDFSGFLDLLTSFDNAVDFKNAKQHTDEMNNSLISTKLLLEKLYRWAHLELGETGFSPQKCILNNYVNSNIDALRMYALKNKISIKSENGSSKVIVDADASMLNFMIWNLLQGAVEIGDADSNVLIGVEKEEKHGIVTITGNSKNMVEFITSYIEKSAILLANNSSNEHQSTNLSFILYNEYLKLMKGELDPQVINVDSGAYKLSVSYAVAKTELEVSN